MEHKGEGDISHSFSLNRVVEVPFEVIYKVKSKE